MGVQQQWRKPLDWRQKLSLWLGIMDHYVSMKTCTFMLPLMKRIYTSGTGPSAAGTVGNLKASLANNKFVTVQANGQLIASSATVGVNEQFLIIDANAQDLSDTRVNTPPTTGPIAPPTSYPASTSQPPSAVNYIQSKSNGKYWVSDFNNHVVATGTNKASAFKFWFVPISGGYDRPIFRKYLLRLI